MDLQKRYIQIAEGAYVEEDVLRVVDKIRETYPHIRVKYCEPGTGTFDSAPYKIVEICRDGIERVVFDVWELNDLVLERLYASDTLKHDVLAQIDRNNALVRKNQLRQFQESMDDAADIVKHVLQRQAGSYTFPRDDGAIVKVDGDPTHKHKVIEK
jgi:hypothetical protein